MDIEAELKQVHEILEKYHQEHLLQFYDELTDTQKEFLLTQILSIPFDKICDLYEISKSEVYHSTENIEPLD